MHKKKSIITFALAACTTAVIVCGCAPSESSSEEMTVEQTESGDNEKLQDTIKINDMCIGYVVPDGFTFSSSNGIKQYVSGHSKITYAETVLEDDITLDKAYIRDALYAEIGYNFNFDSFEEKTIDGQDMLYMELSYSVNDTPTYDVRVYTEYDEMLYCIKYVTTNSEALADARDFADTVGWIYNPEYEG